MKRIKMDITPRGNLLRFVREWKENFEAHIDRDHGWDDCRRSFGQRRKLLLKTATKQCIEKHVGWSDRDLAMYMYGKLDEEQKWTRNMVSLMEQVENKAQKVTK